MMTILRFLLFVRILLFAVDKLRNRWTDRRAVVLNRENERFTVVCFWKFLVVVWQNTSKNSTKVRTARAARL